MQRLAIYPAYALDAGALDRTEAASRQVLRAIDADGLARGETLDGRARAEAHAGGAFARRGRGAGGR